MEGEQFVQNFDKRVEDFRAQAGDQHSKEVSVVRFMPGKVRIYYKQTFSGIVLTDRHQASGGLAKKTPSRMTSQRNGFRKWTAI